MGRKGHRVLVEGGPLPSNSGSERAEMRSTDSANSKTGLLTVLLTLFTSTNQTVINGQCMGGKSQTMLDYVK